MTILVSLIGEQPIPNLLVMRAEDPIEVLMVYSAHTRPVAERLRKLPAMPKLVDCDVNAYDFASIRAAIEHRIAVRRWTSDQLVFNLTGGTKTMAMAAFEVAKALRATFVYLQSEGRKGVLYRYAWEEFAAEGRNDARPVLTDQRELAEIVATRPVTVAQYVQAHVGKWWHDERNAGDPPGRAFEQLVREVLMADEPAVEDVEADVRWSDRLEADLVMRRGSNFAVAELKQGRNAGKKDDLQQLAMIARQQILGTYIQPILILGKQMDQSNIALADSFGIAVIELSSWEQTGDLSDGDRLLLRRRVRELLSSEGAAA